MEPLLQRRKHSGSQLYALVASAFRPKIPLVLAAGASCGARGGGRGHAIRAKRLLGAGAPEGRRLDSVAIERHLLRMRVGLRVHAFMAELYAVSRSDEARVQRVHAQFPFSPAASMTARFTAVRAIWI